MSLAVQNSNFKENSINTNTAIRKTETLSPEEELEQFKADFYEELSKIYPHGTVDNLAINISEEAFKQMKEDPEYKEKILNLIQRDLGSSYAPRNCSVLKSI